jgi:predicted RNA methylase
MPFLSSGGRSRSKTSRRSWSEVTPLSETVTRDIEFGSEGMRDLSAGRFSRAIRTAREMGFAGIAALAREHGLRRTLAFAAHNLRHVIAHRIALRWDRTHNVDTAGSIQLASLSVVGPNRDFGNECVGTSPRSFDVMMQSLPRDLKPYTFVDVGAGKSRTLLLASHYGFARALGVEFAKELVACSRRNIARFCSDRQTCRDLEVVEADATQFVFPATPLVIYFYNPFTVEVFDAVLHNIVISLKAAKRDCYIVYASSSHNAIEWARPAILASGVFEEIPAAPMPLFFDAVRTLRFAVFRAE